MTLVEVKGDIEKTTKKILNDFNLAIKLIRSLILKTNLGSKFESLSGKSLSTLWNIFYANFDEAF